MKFYANPVNVGRKTLDDIARDISGRSSLTRGDISNVLYNFIDCLPHYLRDGFSIQLGEFGSMRVTLSSKGAETEKAFKTETIKPRVVFTPGTELKREQITSVVVTQGGQVKVFACVSGGRKGLRCRQT